MMAVGTVKSAISSILHDKDFDLKTPRMNLTKESAQKIFDAISGNDQGAKKTTPYSAFPHRSIRRTMSTPSGSSGSMSS